MSLRRAIFQIKSYDEYAVHAAVEQARRIAGKMGLSVSGHVFLPRTIRKWTVLKSAFVHKRARDQWEMRTQKQAFVVQVPPEKENAFFHYLNRFRSHLAPSVGMRIRTEEVSVPKVQQQAIEQTNSTHSTVTAPPTEKVVAQSEQATTSSSAQ